MCVYEKLNVRKHRIKSLFLWLHTPRHCFIKQPVSFLRLPLSKCPKEDRSFLPPNLQKSKTLPNT